MRSKNAFREKILREISANPDLLAAVNRFAKLQGATKRYKLSESNIRRINKILATEKTVIVKVSRGGKIVVWTTEGLETMQDIGSRRAKQLCSERSLKSAALVRDTTATLPPFSLEEMRALGTYGK